MKDYEITMEQQIAKLKNLREIAGLAQTDLAKSFEIPLQTLEDWESCRRNLLRLLAYRIRIKQNVKKQNQNVNIIRDLEFPQFYPQNPVFISIVINNFQKMPKI